MKLGVLPIDISGERKTENGKLKIETGGGEEREAASLLVEVGGVVRGCLFESTQFGAKSILPFHQILADK